MNICIVGLGLIGGSLALDLRANGFATRLIGVDNNSDHAQQALDYRLVDEIRSLEEGIPMADLVLAATPVGSLLSLIPRILDLLPPQAVLVDMGSTKSEMAEALKTHPNRRQLVLAHPMAGTEYSGPRAALNNLFQGRAAIICDQEDSDPEAIRLAERCLKSLFMKILYMDSQSHDRHVAYVSHISHISSFVLALTVLEKEKSEANIFNLASGGFASTARLAKSSPRMWADVFEQNADNILDVLDEYVEKMQHFRRLIADKNSSETFRLMEQANDIGRILK